MANAVLRQEVDTLREYMKELSYQAMRTEMALARLSEGMQEYKEQGARTDAAVARLSEGMQEYKEQGARTDAAVARLSAEMREFKDEMQAFKIESRNELREYKEEGARERRQLYKQWGELANRLGTLVEDIVAPNLPRIAAELFACTVPDLFAVRIVRHFGGETREYDAMVVCPDLVLINETKSRLLDTHVDAILDKLAEFPRIYPEYAGRRPVGILASLYPEAGVIQRATRKGVLVMGMGDETMIVLNPDAASPGR